MPRCPSAQLMLCQGPGPGPQGKGMSNVWPGGKTVDRLCLSKEATSDEKK